MQLAAAKDITLLEAMLAPDVEQRRDAHDRRALGAELGAELGAGAIDEQHADDETTHETPAQHQKRTQLKWLLSSLQQMSEPQMLSEREQREHPLEHGTSSPLSITVSTASSSSSSLISASGAGHGHVTRRVSARTHQVELHEPDNLSEGLSEGLSDGHE
jgi:hypothetical protein